MFGNNDVYVEKSRETLGGNIMGSFVAALLGLLFFCGSIYLEMWNEGRAVKDHVSLQGAAHGIVTVDPSGFNPSNEGKVVYLTGTVVTKRELVDRDFDIKSKALRMIRNSSMYQWTEDRSTDTDKKVGGGSESTTTYTYEKEWEDKIVDSSSFRSSSHKNPSAFKFPEQTYTADDATLGQYQLTPKLIATIGATSRISILGTTNMAKLPAAAAGNKISLADGEFYIGANPAAPEIGDERIHYTFAPADTQYSMAVVQNNHSLLPFKAAGGTTFTLVKSGLVSADDLFKAAETENQIMTWCLRFLGLFLMFIGLLMMATPVSAVLNIIPFVGTIAEGGAFLMALGLSWSISLIIIGIAWLAARPILAYGLMGGALLILLLAFYRPSRKT